MEEENHSYRLKAIGWLKSDFKQKFGTPRQGSLAKSSRALLELAPEWKGRGFLSGLEGFSHVWIVSYLHLSHSKNQSAKIHPPRLRGATVGVMASRSPHRPNNIGLTLAKITLCDGDRLELSEIDLVDGTPVLDLKPYLAAADRPEDFKNGWTDTADSFERICEFSDEANQDLENLTQSKTLKEPERIKALITEMLTLDPRPPAYLNRESPRFAVWIAGLNVVFTFSDQTFTVIKIEPGEPTSPA